MSKMTIPMLLAVVLFFAEAFAADSTAVTPITWNAFIDAYYTRNFNDPSNRVNGLRNFDMNENQISLALLI